MYAVSPITSSIMGVFTDVHQLSTMSVSSSLSSIDFEMISMICNFPLFMCCELWVCVCVCSHSKFNSHTSNWRNESRYNCCNSCTNINCDDNNNNYYYHYYWSIYETEKESRLVIFALISIFKLLQYNRTRWHVQKHTRKSKKSGNRWAGHECITVSAIIMCMQLYFTYRPWLNGTFYIIELSTLLMADGQGI